MAEPHRRGLDLPEVREAAEIERRRRGLAAREGDSISGELLDGVTITARPLGRELSLRLSGGRDPDLWALFPVGEGEADSRPLSWRRRTGHDRPLAGSRDEMLSAGRALAVENGFVFQSPSGLLLP